MNQRVLELEEGWAIIQKGVTKLINIIEGVPESPKDKDFFWILHETIYTMCNQKSPGRDYSKQLYERYGDVYNNYLRSIVLPAIQEKHGVFLLRELLTRWENYKVLVSKLPIYFGYLDRHYTPRRRIPTLKDVGFGCFRKIVGELMKVRVKDAVISLISQEREGREIDQTLIKNVIEIFVDLGHENDMPDLEYYVNNFETAFLNDTADYYAWKASNWTKKGFAVKAQICSQKEKDRVSHYLHSSTEEKLLKIVQDTLKQLPEKYNS
ncbi:hypothetical protein MKW92_053576 [Papaver armeniacum]|nr:hypothetical protein MKW92_053576 [Papaver armeniacum]